MSAGHDDHGHGHGGGPMDKIKMALYGVGVAFLALVLIPEQLKNFMIYLSDGFARSMQIIGNSLDSYYRVKIIFGDILAEIGLIIVFFLVVGWFAKTYLLKKDGGHDAGHGGGHH